MGLASRFVSLPPPGTDELSWAGARSAVRRRVQAIVGSPLVDPARPSRHAAVLIDPIAPHDADVPGPEPENQKPPAPEPAPSTAGAAQETPDDAGAGPERIVIPLGPRGGDPDDPAALAEPSRGLPGWLLFVLSMSAVLFTAIAEVRATGAVGTATGVVLVVCSLCAAAFTRRGDLPLAIMMPPLAFVVAVLVAGQLLVAQTGNWKANQTLMMFDQLGGNARWVLVATGVAVVVATARVLISWLLRRRRARRA